MKKNLKWIILAILAIGIIGAAMGGSDKEDSDKKDSPKTEQKEEKKDTYAIGETAEIDGIKITVNSTRIDEGIIAADEGKQYFVMDISLENTRDDKFSSSSLLCYELKDADGRKVDMSVTANLNGSLDTSVEPGEKATGEIAFETATEGELTLKFTPGFGDSIKFKVR